MKIITHRGLWEKPDEQNTIFSFARALESGFGIELDVRDRNSNIVIAHDFPNNNALLFSEFLDRFNHYKLGSHILAINIKSDGLVGEIKRMVEEYELPNYFTFDMSIPEMLRYQKFGLNYFTRLSEYESNPIMTDGSSGIWLDAFENEWYDEEYLNKLVKTVEKVCIVSAELHDREHTNQWSLIKKLNDQNKFMLCTDKPNEAREYFE